MFLRLVLSATFFLVWCFSCVFAATPAIISPANGTKIAPGAQFAFEYQSIADYSVSSYNYTVVLYTKLPSTSFVASSDYAAGYTFGQFDLANYPAVPYARHPAPAYLVMPDFSKLGGMGAGESISNAIFYLAVFEEYGNGEPSVGPRISLSMNYIVYNNTAEEGGKDSDDSYRGFSESQTALL
jgi:hypothetical protein